MGYTTDFTGEFLLNKPLDEETAALLNGLATTRRMKRDIVKLAEMLEITPAEALEKYKAEGQLYYNPDSTQHGQEQDISIVEYNYPPQAQPGLWLQWQYNPNGEYGDKPSISWDGGEKFYYYVEWLKYIIKMILEPKGYTLNGEVTWVGEDSSDHGKLIVKDNQVSTKTGKIVYE